MFYLRNIVLIRVSLFMLISLGQMLHAEDMVFPDDAGVVNVVSEYGADNTGVSDATEAIQRAFDSHPSGNTILYFPNGTYLVSNTIRWADEPDGTQKQKRNILQ